MGLNGTVFDIYKLRTMKANVTGSLRTAVNDSRVSGRWSAFLRRYKLDELPQLFNILKGEMSFVGPRPLAVQHFEDVCQKHPEFRSVTLVRPGLTSESFCSFSDAEVRSQSDSYFSSVADEAQNSNWRSYFRALVATVPKLLQSPRP